MWWVFSLLVVVVSLGKTTTTTTTTVTQSCSFFSYEGKAYAVDRCNGHYERTNEGISQRSYLYRCKDNGTRIDIEYYSTYNCSKGSLYTIIFNASNNYNNNDNNYYFNCHGNHNCDISITTYPLDQPCQGYGYSDWFGYIVYVKDICVNEYSSSTLLTCQIPSNNKEELNIITYSKNKCQLNNNSHIIYQNNYLDGCKYYNNSNNPDYYYYHINCNASNESFPISKYQPHYCEINDCSNYQTTQNSIVINNNDINSCSYIDWYGQTYAPNVCMYTYDYSFMYKCVENNTKALLYYYEDINCGDKYPSDHFYPNPVDYGVMSFNCIGHNRCHAEYIYYGYGCKSNDIERHYVYATDICDHYLGTSYKTTCENDQLNFYAWYAMNDCSDESRLPYSTISDGCDDYGDKYEINCNYSGKDNSFSPPSSSSSEGLSKSAKITIIVTIVLVVLILIAVAIITYITRASRFKNPTVNKNYMLTDNSLTQDKDILNPRTSIGGDTANTTAEHTL